MTLIDLEINQIATIHTSNSRRLLEMGLGKGTTIQYLQKSPFDFPRIFKVRNFLVALNENECNMVLI